MNDSSSQPQVPAAGPLIGLDFGTKRIGVAICNSDQTIASPLENYTRQSKQDDARHFDRLFQDYRAVGLVVGLPVHMSGEEGQQAREARKFGSRMGEQLGLPVGFWDERYTSAFAEQHLTEAGLSKKKRKARMDKLAAQIMLQSFLDAPDRNRKPEAF